MRLAEPGSTWSVVTPPARFAGKLRILRPHRMLGPDIWRDRIGCFVAVAQRVYARRRINAEVRVDVDDAGRDVFAGSVDYDSVARRIDRLSDGGDLSVLEQDRAIPDHRAGGGEDVDVTNHGRARRERNVSAGEGVRVRKRDASASGGVRRRESLLTDDDGVGVVVGVVPAQASAARSNSGFRARMRSVILRGSQCTGQ